MAYLSPWERLDDATERVVSEAGVSKNEAQTHLCRAIAEMDVRIWAKLRKHATKGMTSSKTVLEGGAFHIPPRIEPEDFDWEMSRPLKPWPIQPGKFSIPGRWELEWIEVMRADVTTAFCPPENVLAGPAIPRKGSQKTRADRCLTGRHARSLNCIPRGCLIRPPFPTKFCANGSLNGSRMTG